jgi:hypothetical protein
MARLSTVALTAFLSAAVANAFVAPSVNTNVCTQSACFARTALFAEESGSGSEAVFMADEGEADEDKTFEAVEKLGRGAAKSKRGKRKGGAAEDVKERKAAVSLAPEEVYYEGPPAITETIVPTISILTVVGIIPAAAAWARQAWVRYKITSRRIRVTSGVNGQDMAEIVYPDITEVRTVKRLFGDGDMVAFLRDGAKFEMRNIPEFDDTMEFVMKQVDPEVAKAWREKGDVTLPPQ